MASPSPSLPALLAGAGGLAAVALASAVFLRRSSPSAAAPSHGKHAKERFSPALNVILVRHAESANNVFAREAQQQFGHSPYREGSDANAFYCLHRVPDPPLSPLGLRQAEALRAHPYLARIGIAQLHAEGRVRLLCSPLERAIQTADQVARVMGRGAFATSMPDLCERGGCYTGGGRGSGFVPGRTRAELSEAWPAHDFSACSERGWWAGITSSAGFEDAPEFEARMDRVVEFLRELAWQHRAEVRRRRAADRGEAAAVAGSPDYVVIVAHADFLAQLLSRLMNLRAPSLYPFRHENASVSHVGLSFHRRKRDDAAEERDQEEDGGGGGDEHSRAVRAEYLRSEMYGDLYALNQLVGLDVDPAQHV